MEETLKMMKSIITGKECKVNENELIKEYQKELSPNILAYFYVDNYRILQKTNLYYSILSTEDKASFCLQELDKCLQNYKLDNKVKFITYFIRCYKNRLRTESELLNTQKRKAMLNIIDIDNIEINANCNLIEDTDFILNNYDLTKEEKKQCKLLNMGYSIKEIAKILGLAPITIYKRNDKIKQKILNLDINFA